MRSNIKAQVQQSNRTLDLEQQEHLGVPSIAETVHALPRDNSAPECNNTHNKKITK
jgi:hypothetical protein